MPIYKRCSLCHKRRLANEKCNCYNTGLVRNKPKENAYYYTSDWSEARDQAITNVFGLDIYSFYVLNKIEYGFTVHHIIPLEDDYALRNSPSNLIYLTESNHRKIHGLYKTGKKKETIQLLQQLSNEFIRTYRI